MNIQPPKAVCCRYAVPAGSSVIHCDDTVHASTFYQVLLPPQNQKPIPWLERPCSSWLKSKVWEKSKIYKEKYVGRQSLPHTLPCKIQKVLTSDHQVMSNPFFSNFDFRYFQSYSISFWCWCISGVLHGHYLDIPGLRKTRCFSCTYCIQ